MPSLAQELSNRCRNYHPEECLPFRVSDIESVCAQIAELEADRGAVTAKVNTRLEAERDRLREALERIEAEAYEMGPTTWGLSEIARAALNSE